jgi:hypothetical protein
MDLTSRELTGWCAEGIDPCRDGEGRRFVGVPVGTTRFISWVGAARVCSELRSSP